MDPNAPFPATRAEGKASGDPRPSIEARYPSKEDYLHQVRHAAEALVQQGYVLSEDLPTIVEQASQRYDLFYSRVKVVPAAQLAQRSGAA